MSESRTFSPYSDEDLEADLRWWSAANYLTVAQIYLQDNTLLREPLRAEHIKPRLLGHWGTSPGLSAIYTVLNRVIRQTDSDWLFVTGPGHGGPALVANVYLEGTYSEIYPDVSTDARGIHRLCRQFSTPGGIPSHVSVQTPGSIHEGGELGYALAHAAGAAFDHPELLVACVIGDGEAETGPLAASWNVSSFLDPTRDGAVLPILHLNGAKISGPTVMGRRSDDQVANTLRGQGWEPIFVEGDDPRIVFRALISAITQSYNAFRAGNSSNRRPAIVLRTPKGWTGPHEVDGRLVEGTHRAHQVPLSGVRENPEHLRLLENWLRSYRPEELFDDDGRIVSEVAALAPIGDRRMGATPYANGGRILKPLPLPSTDRYALDITRPGATNHPTTRVLGEYLRDIYFADQSADGGGTFRLFCPDETASNRLDAVFEATDRCWQLPLVPEDDNLAPKGRVMEVLSEHLCQGWLEGYLLSGRHGLFASYEAFAMISASMLVQHTKWLQHATRLDWRIPVASLNILLTSTCWRNDHNGFSHQGPGLIDAVLSLSPDVVRVWLPPDANTLLSIAEHCFRSRDHVNVIVADKQPHLQYLSIDDAERQCAAGASTWDWAGNESDTTQPDVVLAAAGDVPTQEILAAAQLLREWTPEICFRVVNVIDLMALLPESAHPHGMPDSHFIDLFAATTDVVFAFHGYPRAVHQLLHGRPAANRFHVRGFSEQGTTTTPFDMVVLNRMSRYHLVSEALTWIGRDDPAARRLADHCRSQLERHYHYVRENFEDMPEVRDWTWS
ncbi:xylulose-5-phosphate/fructose-6-phosphate phosphoketolase [Gordonia effusa NBRC 100432]|uniref:Xylulose-5-phosphate/fructose-6-phosphate phosphoketolase n=1 Tax=Gordonia effusa NBRC 100432 TaxID=1077974 RepID=H0R006_9ACTN|nr:phosphoketolase family protein [Gordonia effusa]GAB18407.1 xylulose-5-phosphate/fructose-6-phosphate phosphoketolase [Gordonia effusa NBRC 100432]